MPRKSTLTDEEKRERANAKRRETRKTESTGNPRGRPQSSRLDLANATEIPKLLVLGKGSLQGRAMHALRIRPELMSRLKRIAAGPTYLLVELAIEGLCEKLEAQADTKVIKAEDL